MTLHARCPVWGTRAGRDFIPDTLSGFLPLVSAFFSTSSWPIIGTVCLKKVTCHHTESYKNKQKCPVACLAGWSSSGLQLPAKIIKKWSSEVRTAIAGPKDTQTDAGVLRPGRHVQTSVMYAVEDRHFPNRFVVTKGFPALQNCTLLESELMII